jgi:hypothetical protein
MQTMIRRSEDTGISRFDAILTAVDVSLEDYR